MAPWGVSGKRSGLLGAVFATAEGGRKGQKVTHGRATWTRKYIGDGRWAILLSAPQPSWYTKDLHRQVLAAAERGEGVALPADASADYEAAGLAFTGIRPGSWMISPSGCTMNWVFGSASGNLTLEASAPSGKGGAGRWTKGDKPSTKGGKPSAPGEGGGASSSTGVYIGTAGHCTEVGDEVVIVALPGVLMNIGTTVKSIDQGSARTSPSSRSARRCCPT